MTKSLAIFRRFSSLFTAHCSLLQWYRSAWMPRVLPFAIFMAFIGVQELAGFLARYGVIHPYESLAMVLYPVKALAAGAALLFYASNYSELRPGDLSKLPHTLVSVCTGLLVFVL